MAIELPPEFRKQASASIRTFFAEELDQDIGDLKAELVLDFFLRELAPSVHNAAIGKAQVYLRDRLVDLEAVTTEPEFMYWPKSGPRSRKR